MANPDHLELLKQGTKPWNAWRRKHRGLRPDLSGDVVSDVEHQIGMLAEAVVNEVMPGRCRRTKVAFADSIWHRLTCTAVTSTPSTSVAPI